MKRYLLDTNHLSAALERVSSLRERLYQQRRSGARIGICAPVLCELEAGIQQTRRLVYYRRNLASLLGRIVRLWPLDTRVTQQYGAIYQELRNRGRALSQVDMMVAALGRSMNLTVLTSDRDFEALPDIETENWLSS